MPTGFQNTNKIQFPQNTNKIQIPQSKFVYAPCLIYIAANLCNKKLFFTVLAYNQF